LMEFLFIGYVFLRGLELIRKGVKTGHMFTFFHLVY